MTDAEKELRRLAQEVEAGGATPPPDAIRRLQDMLWPKDVLALLDRIEALEKGVVSAHRELYDGKNDKESALSAEAILSEFVP